MRITRALYWASAAVALALALSGSPVPLQAQTTPPAVAIDNDDIGGVVTGPNGPEAGVWVIAETRDLPTRYAKMVVTDDQGRYVVPDLPKAKYKVWVRGYGLVDSPKVDATARPAAQSPRGAGAERGGGGAVLSGDLLVLDAEDSAGERLRRIDRHSSQGDVHRLAEHHEEQRLRRLPSARPAVDAHDPEGIRQEFVTRPRPGCGACRPASPASRWSACWPGQLGGVPFKYFGDWTDRVAKGELPHTKPTRPQGVERNIVVTTWDWGTEKQYLHDLVASDRRFPTVNAYGPVFGSPEYSTDAWPILDPKTHTVTYFNAPVARRDDRHGARPGSRGERPAGRAVALLGQRADLGYQDQQPQRHVRSPRPGLVRGARTRQQESGLLQEGLGPSVGQGVPGERVAPAAVDAGSRRR